MRDARLTVPRRRFVWLHAYSHDLAKPYERDSLRECVMTFVWHYLNFVSQKHTHVLYIVESGMSFILTFFFARSFSALFVCYAMIWFIVVSSETNSYQFLLLLFNWFLLTWLTTSNWHHQWSCFSFTYYLLLDRWNNNLFSSTFCSLDTKSQFTRNSTNADKAE